MIKCVIHCSDIHIRNFQRLGEYAEQLTRFVEKCKEDYNCFEEQRKKFIDEYTQELGEWITKKDSERDNEKT